MAWKFRWPWQRLRALGIMGLNERNADFILPYNPRRNYPLVDDKRRTKTLAMAAGIPVPELYAAIEIVHEIERLGELLGAYEDFVVKPAHGSGGEGIMIVAGRHGGRYRKADGSLADDEELGHHIANILSGMYSLGGLPDSALIEYRVKFDPIFEHVSFQGVPDIRTLVFRGVPVLAMIRLPTRLSDGKANLHQGAIGVGIDLATGCTFSGVWHESPVEHHPDTGGCLAGLQIPYWDDILSLTARCHDLAGLGFIGVDIVLDESLGPMMLEINARPGLSIQLANKLGLLPRLRKLEALPRIPESIPERVKLAKSLALWL
ncbi:alpha-L-glutamate ligase-related protein [Methylomagnum ishizawai]|uniref:Alpha-L-glutamate ligase-related protein n=1 Tax=Methylomagnum ishizawai TaxID=1760988 RepID=A0A1Y6CZT6_9GAMM|nr:alpha-L-glutamate ligase-like protein [Methylomagnum ishizawai]SMF94093.1 alpha-L-glutamate ligase-related protein [Methylomagnum ishizawai]